MERNTSKRRALIRGLLSLINKLVPKRKRQIAIYGRQMLNDNTEALLDYLIKEGYNDRYHIKLLITPNVIHNKYDGLKNIGISHNPIVTIWILMRSSFIFHSQGMSVCSLIPCRKQIIFDLWHGSPLKLIGAAAGNEWHPETDSYFLCASPLLAKINKRCFLLKDNQIFIGSNPRNDYMFVEVENRFIQHLKGNRRMILFMPTFRNSKDLDRHDAKSDFPLLNEQNIHDFDDFLGEKNVAFVIKPHPYQNDISLFKKRYNHIRVIYNSDLQKRGIPLYEMLGHSDALVSDFSSVYFDYLLLDRPIAFAVDDMDDYGTNRGFTFDKPFDYMPGVKLADVNDLKQFVKDVIDGNDSYKGERKRVNDLCNTYQTPDASKRILDFVGIKR